MSQDHDQFPASNWMESPQAPSRKRRWRTPALVVGGLLVAALGATWLAREDIANNLIGGELEALGLPARYEIVRISPSEQVIRNLVVGDPQRPDLTVKELRVSTRLAWGLPGIGRITVIEPRLYGSYRAGRVSFGALDKALFTGKDGPFEIPDLDIKLVDGRALIESDLGRLGVKLAGEGALRGGFSGEIAAISPASHVSGCRTGRATLYGKLAVTAARPRFTGPVRLESLGCQQEDARASRVAAQVDITLDEALDGAEGKLGVSAGASRYGAQSLTALSGTGRFSYREESLRATYRIEGKGLDTPQARLAAVAFEGRARSANGFSRFDVEGDLTGRDLRIGASVDRALVSAQRTGEGTLLAPLAAQVRSGLAQEMPGSTLDANLIARRSADGLSLVVTRGALRGRSGASLVALSRVQALLPEGGEGAPPRLTGNFSTGGKGLPQVWGRVETDGHGRFALRGSMPDYRAGSAMIGIPRLAVKQDRDGALSFAGQILMSGDLPGGKARNLLLPLDGRRDSTGRFALWRGCTRVAFDALQVADLALDRRTLTLCPARGGAIVQGQPDNLRLAAGASSLNLSGRLGETPIRIASGPIGLAAGGGRAGVVTARAVDVALGPESTASRFAISRIDAALGKDVSGTFEEADIRLAAVPLDMRQAAGNWSYAGGIVAIDDASFTLVDRQPMARFQPMVARGATLRLAGNRITAKALLREPQSDRGVVRADIVHDLSNASGHADLAVNGAVFDKDLQPDALSRLALGVVSDLQGIVRGSGRIDWNAARVTSRGRFATDGVDFAAALGPVRGLSGEVVFTDLLGMVTAPRQTIRIASMNPGVEVKDGTLSFELRPGYNLIVNGGQWPFMSGTLTLDPAKMQIGVAETRRYTLRVSGLDAGDFVQHLELTNINASGVFDGELPLIFDQNGGRIEDGYLRSRAPGGHLSYIGALTYKDLSAMGNFAFDALKSVNYKDMEIGLGGSLSGEILTRISFDGLSQGAGAKKNFLTKQVAKLPIRFIVNIRAPFFSLFGSMRSLYDPNYVRDPRELGLLTQDGTRSATAPDATVNPPPPPSAAIQPPVSEKTP
ncbi:YdbH domain-containing protein [Novosphingobium panipatense]|uniref:Dicarboxylate transport n=3 Tax=Novosphingobium panipatense TaxID=428991 RepID=A0ABY1Q1E2_9SPHN|nr:Dicarboxylate transport [Novosphingobium panipatense]